MKSLLRLSHPNIVELLGVGMDAQTKERYLVLDWMEDDLEGVLADAPAWDEFLRRWGLPVLRGLAHAHDLGVSHRDLKPANVLVDAEQNPRISDFGIAKIATTVDPGHTLQGWHSAPYTPREPEDGSEDYSRDVHAFGVLTLFGTDRGRPGRRAVRQPLTTRSTAASRSSSAPRRSPSCSPAASRRIAPIVPRDGAAALRELERVLEELQAEQRPPALRPSTSRSSQPRRYLESEFDLSAQGAQEEFILAELADGVGVAPMDGEKFKDGTPTEGHYAIYAGTLRLHAALSQERDRLHLISAMAMRPSYLERERERSARSSFAGASVPIEARAKRGWESSNGRSKSTPRPHPRALAVAPPAG